MATSWFQPVTPHKKLDVFCTLSQNTPFVFFKCVRIKFLTLLTNQYYCCVFGIKVHNWILRKSSVMKFALLYRISLFDISFEVESRLKIHGFSRSLQLCPSRKEHEHKTNGERWNWRRIGIQRYRWNSTDLLIFL